MEGNRLWTCLSRTHLYQPELLAILKPLWSSSLQSMSHPGSATQDQQRKPLGPAKAHFQTWALYPEGYEPARLMGRSTLSS
jgi:hypothetical protein